MKLKGVNLGGWLMMEGYILGGRNIAAHILKNKFKKIYGNDGLVNFEKCFSGNFITKDDFRRIKLLGANCLRVPFNYRMLEGPGTGDRFKYLDKVFAWAKDYNFKIILDLHAAPGAQNCDWHADSSGKTFLWEKEHLRKKTYRIWEEIACRYRNDKCLYGYDVLNEPVVNKKKLPVLIDFYKKVVKRIRGVDKKSVIFLEGNLWAQDIDFLERLLSDRVTVSVHCYQPLNFTFNFVGGTSYPGKVDGLLWNKRRIYKYLENYYKFSRRHKVDIFIGEFGINYKRNSRGEIDYLSDLLEVFDAYSFGHTYWTYKAVSRYVFPDGIYQFLDNPSWIRRQGPSYGWENYTEDWRDKKKDIIKSWRTENFTLNKEVAGVLKKHFRE